MNVYCVMCTVYMAYLYAYIPAHLYLGILGKLGIMYVPLQKRKRNCIAVNTAPSVNPGNVMQSLEVGGLPAGDMQRLKLLFLVANSSLFVRHHRGQQGAAEAHDSQSSTHAPPLLPREEDVGESWNTRISENGVSS